MNYIKIKINKSHYRQILKYLLQHNIKFKLINIRNHSKNRQKTIKTPVQVSIWRNFYWLKIEIKCVTSIVDFLRKNNLDWEIKKYFNLLSLLVKNNLLDDLKYFMNYDLVDINDLTILLSEACAHSSIEIISYLLDLGADPFVNYDCALRNACYRDDDDVEIVKFLLAYEKDSKKCDINAYNGQAISLAAEKNNLCTIKYIVSNGFDIKKYGYRGLVCAVLNNNNDVVTYLTDLGITLSNEATIFLADYGLS